MDTNKRNARKVALTVLALGGATAAVVFGSLAAWTATTTNPGNSVTAGTLTMSNDKDGATIFDSLPLPDAIKPGDTGSDTVTIANTGDIPLTLTVTKDNETANALASDLDYYIQDPSGECIVPAPVTPGDSCAVAGWENWSTTQTDLAMGTLAKAGDAGDSKMFTFGWRFENTGALVDQNASQGLSAAFDLTWNGTP